MSAAAYMGSCVLALVAPCLQEARVGWRLDLLGASPSQEASVRSQSPRRASPGAAQGREGALVCARLGLEASGSTLLPGARSQCAQPVRACVGLRPGPLGTPRPCPRSPPDR